MKKQNKKEFIEVTPDGKQEIEEGVESLDKQPKEYPIGAAQSNYQDAQNEEEQKKKLKKKDQIKGGLADNNKPSDFNEKQIEMGIKVEMEHTDDKGKAREIAMDHLKEFPDYYTRLDAMEDKAKKDMSKSISDRWVLIKKKLNHEDSFMDIDIENDEDEDEEEGDSDSDMPEEEMQKLLNLKDEDPSEDSDGDGILEGEEEGEQPNDLEDQEEGGEDKDPVDTATESEEDIPEDVVEEAGGEEAAEKLSNDEIEAMMEQMGYSTAEIAHVVHGHTVHHDPEEDMKREAHEHDMQIKQNEAAMSGAKAGAENDHVKNTNSMDLDRVNELNDIEIEHERRMKELDYSMARRARELELKYKERELEQKLKHGDKDAKVKRDQKKEQHKSKTEENSNKHERKLVDNVVN